MNKEDTKFLEKLVNNETYKLQPFYKQLQVLEITDENDIKSLYFFSKIHQTEKEIGRRFFKSINL